MVPSEGDFHSAGSLRLSLHCAYVSRGGNSLSISGKPNSRLDLRTGIVAQRQRTCRGGRSPCPIGHTRPSSGPQMGHTLSSLAVTHSQPWRMSETAAVPFAQSSQSARSYPCWRWLLPLCGALWASLVRLRAASALDRCLLPALGSPSCCCATYG